MTGSRLNRLCDDGNIRRCENVSHQFRCEPEITFRRFAATGRQNEGCLSPSLSLRCSSTPSATMRDGRSEDRNFINQSKTRTPPFCYSNKVMDATRLPDDRSPLHALLAALKPMSDRHSHMPLAWIKTLLLVALDEGKGVANYSREPTCIEQSCRDLFIASAIRVGWIDNPGLGLVEVKVDPVARGSSASFFDRRRPRRRRGDNCQFGSPKNIS